MARRLRYALLWCVTCPYFWTFLHFTLNPIRVIQACQDKDERLACAMKRFRSAKEHELKFVKVAVSQPSWIPWKIRTIAEYIPEYTLSCSNIGYALMVDGRECTLAISRSLVLESSSCCLCVDHGRSAYSAIGNDVHLLKRLCNQ